MVEKLELQDAIAKNPDLLINRVLSAMTKKEIKKSYPKLRQKFVKKAYACIGKMGAGGMMSERGLNACIADKWGRLAVTEKIISERDLKVRIKNIGYDGMLKEIKNALDKGTKEILAGYFKRFV